MGVVYRARQRGLKRTVALKTIRYEELDSAESRERFRVEAAQLARQLGERVHGRCFVTGGLGEVRARARAPTARIPLACSAVTACSRLDPVLV